MLHESVELGAVLAPVISALAVVGLYHYLGREYLGADENRYWNMLRRRLLSTLNQYVMGRTPFGLMNRATEADRIGGIALSSNELAHSLEDAGYVQGVLSGLKYRPPDVPAEEAESLEAGSMVFRESKSDLLPDSLALHQNHVYWFENSDGTVEVYAHYEYSSLNPLVSWKHYRAVGQDSEEGERRVRGHLATVGVEL